MNEIWQLWQILGSVGTNCHQGNSFSWKAEEIFAHKCKRRSTTHYLYNSGIEKAANLPESRLISVFCNNCLAEMMSAEYKIMS